VRIFVDASAYIAYFNVRDKNHGRAMSFLERVRNREIWPVVFFTSDYVFDEVVSVILILTGRRDLAARVGDAILSSKITRVIRVNNEIFRRAWDLFKKCKEKSWTFTDCTSFIIMEMNGIKTAFTFDEHFREAGYTVVP